VATTIRVVFLWKFRRYGNNGSLIPLLTQYVQIALLGSFIQRKFLSIILRLWSMIRALPPWQSDGGTICFPWRKSTKLEITDPRLPSGPVGLVRVKTTHTREATMTGPTKLHITLVSSPIQQLTNNSKSYSLLIKNHIKISCKLTIQYAYTFITPYRHWFLPRCMKCRRGLAMRILSVRPSVCLSVCQWMSHACIVTKR